jgi:hypothetical protein
VIQEETNPDFRVAKVFSQASNLSIGAEVPLCLDNMAVLVEIPARLVVQKAPTLFGEGHLGDAGKDLSL